MERAPDADVLCDHLKQRQSIGMLVSSVNIRRNLNDAHRAVFVVRRPAQCFRKGGPFLRWVPFHHDDFGRQLITPALIQEAVEESLHPKLQCFAVIVVAGGHYQRNVWRGVARGHCNIKLPAKMDFHTPMPRAAHSSDADKHEVSDFGREYKVL